MGRTASRYSNNNNSQEDTAISNTTRYRLSSAAAGSQQRKRHQANNRLEPICESQVVVVGDKNEYRNDQFNWQNQNDNHQIGRSQSKDEAMCCVGQTAATTAACCSVMGCSGELGNNDDYNNLATCNVSNEHNKSLGSRVIAAGRQQQHHHHQFITTSLAESGDCCDKCSINDIICCSGVTVGGGSLQTPALSHALSTCLDQQSQSVIQAQTLTRDHHSRERRRGHLRAGQQQNLLHSSACCYPCCSPLPEVTSSSNNNHLHHLLAVSSAARAENNTVSIGQVDAQQQQQQRRLGHHDHALDESGGSSLTLLGDNNIQRYFSATGSLSFEQKQRVVDHAKLHHCHQRSTITTQQQPAQSEQGGCVSSGSSSTGSSRCANELAPASLTSNEGASSNLQNTNNNNNNNNTSQHQHQLSVSQSQAKQQDSKLVSGSNNNIELENNKSEWSHMDWKDIARRYGKIPRQHRGQFWWGIRESCFCHVLLSTLDTLFPVLTAFKSYSLPGDLITDLVAGFTIAVLHIPQGMAYGLLAGVEPIYGLYVSFVPVLIMAFMSKSRHVSYGTFAVISMLLSNATDSVRLMLSQQVVAISKSPPPPRPPGHHHEALTAPIGVDGIVLTNNHQLIDSLQQQQQRQVLRNLLVPQTTTLNNHDDQLVVPITGDDNSTSWILTGHASNLWSFAIDPSAEFVIPSNIEILTSVCIVVGLIQMFMALMRLGILSLMFSDQLVSSFTTASAVHVLTSQLGGVFDLTLPPVPEGLFRVCRIWWTFGGKVLEGFNHYTALLSLFSFIFLLGVKEILEPLLRRRHKSFTCLPSELFLMSFLIFGSWYWDFDTNYGINIIGHVPTGLPAPQMPRLDLVPLVIEDAFTVALVSFAMNLSLAQVYAKKYRYTMDPNQELFALGTSNVVSSFFSCFPCASSLSRSAVQSNLNARSQLCSLFSCAIVVSIICYFAPILHDLPRSTLSCIIIVALKGILVQIMDLYENWRLSKLDALVWITTFTSVIVFGVTYGLVLGIVASLFMVFFRLLTPNHSILGQLPDTELFVDTNAFIDCREVDQVKIFRFNSALCYLNRTMFKSSVEKSLPSIFTQQSFNLCGKKHKQKQQTTSYSRIKFLIIDCSALAYCDYSGAATLIDMIEELEEHKVCVFLAACPLKLINMIEKMQRTKVLDQNVYPSITDAVNHAKYLNNFTATRQQHQQSGSSTDSELGKKEYIRDTSDPAVDLTAVVS